VAVVFCYFFYSANFGNVLGISVVHTMEVWRYSTVQFIAALFAQFWALRWLLEIVLTKLSKSRLVTRATCLRHTATSMLKAGGVGETIAMEIIGRESEAISRQ
jgi:hypothetical protein